MTTVPQQALDLVLRKVQEKAPGLANSLQSAIDAGKDITKTELSTKRTKSRTYRKTVPLTDEDALLIVMSSLQAYFLEQALFANSAVREFQDAALADRADLPRKFASGDSTREWTEGAGLEKQLHVELQTEMQISPPGAGNRRLDYRPFLEMCWLNSEHISSVFAPPSRSIANRTMASLADLESAIDALLNHPLGIQQYELIRPVEGKAYEAYVFALCLRAVRELGVTPVLCGRQGPPNPFIFRGAPGQIHSTSRNYGYAAFFLNGYSFEIHAGVEFRGSSGMTHELDVCVMRGDDAEECRRQPDDPPSASLVGGWECKFHAGNLQKGLGRAFVGLMDDMGTNVRLCGLCSNSVHPQLQDYFQPRRRPYPHFRLTPLEPSNENIFVNQLKGELKKMTAW